ncbi:MAG: hypothetical protein E7352_04340 [Clostridiales bacterium]|nr:hypothetical protein [Clostridiales bacterium]
MNVETEQEKGQITKPKARQKWVWARSAKECAYLAAFVALVIGGQVALSPIPGVEIVTVLFVSYAFVFGISRGMIASTAFSLLRQLVFPFSPPVLILYLVYYNFLTATFGFFGRIVKRPLVCLWWLTVAACLCTACFTMLDNLVTPWWLGFSERAKEAYVYASLSFMIPQIICTAITMGVLFYPLQRVFRLIKKGLR